MKKETESLLPKSTIDESQPIHNSFYIPTPLTEEQKSRFVKYEGFSRENNNLEHVSSQKEPAKKNNQ